LIPKTSQHMHDRHILQQMAIDKNRPVINAKFINGIVTPRREPIACIPIVVPAPDKSDGGEMLSPPKTIVPVVPISSECIGITEANLGRRALERWLLFA